MSSQKEVTRIHPYTAATIRFVEVWLAHMAERGWKLKSLKGWKFSFTRCQSSVRKYFMYLGFDASKGYYEHYSYVKRTYGLNSSPLDRLDSVFEVDPCKANEELDKYYSQRDRYYCHKYGSVAVLLLVFELGTCILADYWGSWVPACMLILPTVYCVISFILVLVTRVCSR